MRFFGKRIMKTNIQSAWFRVLLWLCLAVIWSFLSLKTEGERFNILELRIMILCQTGLIALGFISRYHLFPNIRSPIFFKWATGLFLLVFLGLKISPIMPRMLNIPGPVGTSPFSWGEMPFVCMEGLIVSLLAAWLAEVVFGVYRNWSRLPRFEPGVSDQFWDHLWMDILKIGLLMTLLMILGYIYIIHFLLVDTVRYGYLITVPVLLSGVGLLLIFVKKNHDWRANEIRAIDHKLAPYLNWQQYVAENEFQFTERGVLPWVQYLLIIRDYLRRMQRPYIRWWVVTVYLLFCGIMVNLPHWFRVVIEAY